MVSTLDILTSMIHFLKHLYFIDVWNKRSDIVGEITKYSTKFGTLPRKYYDPTQHDDFCVIVEMYWSERGLVNSLLFLKYAPIAAINVCMFNFWITCTQNSSLIYLLTFIIINNYYIFHHTIEIYKNGYFSLDVSSSLIAINDVNIDIEHRFYSVIYIQNICITLIKKSHF